MKKFLFIKICICLLFCFLSCKNLSSENDSSGIISGTITFDDETQEKSGFCISIPGTSYISFTDKKGNFNIFNVPADSYEDLFIQKKDFSYYYELKFEVTAGSTFEIGTINLTLSKSDNDEQIITKFKTKAPTFSVSSGDVDYQDKISIFCETPEATIYYSIDEGKSFTRYTKPIVIQDDIKISAYARLFLDSDISNAEYKIKLYEITYHTDDSLTTPPKITGLKKGDIINLPSFEPKTGYHTTWYTDSAYTNILNSIDSKITVEKTIDLYHKFDNNIYDIVYVFDDQYFKLPEIYSQEYTYGENLSLPQMIDLSGTDKNKEYDWYFSYQNCNQKYLYLSDVNLQRNMNKTGTLYAFFDEKGIPGTDCDDSYIPWLECVDGNYIFRYGFNGYIIEEYVECGFETNDLNWYPDEDEELWGSYDIDNKKRIWIKYSAN